MSRENPVFVVAAGVSLDRIRRALAGSDLVVADTLCPDIFKITPAQRDMQSNVIDLASARRQ